MQAIAVLLLAGISVSRCVTLKAGELMVYNTSDQALTCKAEGYTKATGWYANVKFRIQPGTRLNLPPSMTTGVLNSVDCGKGLRTRGMNVTLNGPDVTLFLNGQQTRTLNVLLYPFIPTNPLLGFAPLLRGITQTYQAAHPDVLLNIVLNPSIDIYDFANMANILGPQGYDIAELDTVFLSFLAQNRLITPATITGDEPLPAAKQAAMVNGTLYGVPSWLCADFLFSFSPQLQRVQTYGQLESYLSTMPAYRLAFVGDFDGKWTVPAAYINAFVQTYGYDAWKQALVMPPDPAIIKKISDFVSFCVFSESNGCVNGYYHNAPDGTVERVLASGNASNGLGFLERSFYIQLYEPSPQPLSLVPLPWGNTAQADRVTYSDALVTNSATCSTAPCRTDSIAFAAFLTSAKIKSYIAFSADLPPGTPPRHLLPATQPFYAQTVVKNDPVYQQASKFISGRLFPYPNIFTPDLQSNLLRALCPALQQPIPSWQCSATAAKARTVSSVVR